MSKQRLKIGAINLLVLFAHRMIRMFVIYFSMVRRRAACASLVNESASFMITTGEPNSQLKKGGKDEKKRNM